MDTYSEIFNLLLNDKYLGIVHWGLWFDVKRKNLWGHINTNEFKSFVKNYAFFNSDKVFCNDFTRETGLDDLAFSQQ